MKVLVLSHQGIGDIVISLPIYKSVRVKYPDATVWSTVKSEAEKNLLVSQCVSDVFIMSDYYSMSYRLKFLFLVGFLMKRFDLIIVPVGINVKYAVLIRLLSLSKRIIAERQNRFYDLFISNPVVFHSKAKRVYNNNKIVQMLLGVDSFPEINASVEINDLLDSHELLLGSKFVGVHMGSGIIEKHKRWPVGHYISLMNEILLINNEIVFLLFGVDSERELADQVLSDMRANSNNIVSLCGSLELDESIAVIQKCGFFISADSGLMHIASALNIPTLSIFGPTSSSEIAPYWNNGVVIEASLPCSPCYPDLVKGCENPMCMKLVTSEHAMDVIMNNHALMCFLKSED